MDKCINKKSMTISSTETEETGTITVSMAKRRKSISLGILIKEKRALKLKWAPKFKFLKWVVYLWETLVSVSDSQSVIDS